MDFTRFSTESEKIKTGNLFTLDVLGVPRSIPSRGLQFTLMCGTLCPPGPIYHSNKGKYRGPVFFLLR
jgi:hypothetical protein